MISVLRFETKLNLHPYKSVTFDLETIKCKGNWKWGDGSTNSNRWVPFMCGIGHVADNRIEVEIITSLSEAMLVDTIITQLGMYSSNTEGVVSFLSMNRFDEMVLKGQFIHGRRRPASSAGSWPHYSGPSEVNPDLRFRPQTFGMDPFSRIRGELPECQTLYYRGIIENGVTVIPPTLEAEMALWRDHCARDVIANLWRDCPLARLENYPEIWEFYRSPSTRGELWEGNGEQ